MRKTTKQLTLSTRATEEISTVEISEVVCHNTEEMNVAESTLTSLPKTKGEGIIAKEDINPAIRTEEEITPQTFINNNQNKLQHHKEAHTMEIEEQCLDKQANGVLIAQSQHTTQISVRTAKKGGCRHQ